MIRRALLWIALHVRLGRLSPWIMGLALGSRPRRLAPMDPMISNLIDALEYFADPHGWQSYSLPDGTKVYECRFALVDPFEKAREALDEVKKWRP